MQWWKSSKFIDLQRATRAPSTVKPKHVAGTNTGGICQQKNAQQFWAQVEEGNAARFSSAFFATVDVFCLKMNTCLMHRVFF